MSDQVDSSLPKEVIEIVEGLDAKAKRIIRDIERRYARITFRHGEKIEAMKNYAAGKLTEEKVTEIFTYMDLMNDHDLYKINEANAEFMLDLFGKVEHV